MLALVVTWAQPWPLRLHLQAGPVRTLQPVWEASQCLRFHRRDHRGNNRVAGTQRCQLATLFLPRLPRIRRNHCVAAKEGDLPESEWLQLHVGACLGHRHVPLRERQDDAVAFPRQLNDLPLPRQ